jgi:uncharacterized membrane protein YoaK (UPF0700 family)
MNFFRHPKHGPLPAILLLLTFGTGVVDAISILGLGRVFVANMTGNIVFIGFALAGAPGYSVWGSLVALAAFLVGATIGGVVIARMTSNRGGLLRNSLSLQLALIVAALVISAISGDRLGAAMQVVVLALAALGLGLQNAVVRRLAVPDMTTTVLTMTLTGIASDLRNRDTATALRRSLAVLAMLVGATLGGLIVLDAGATAGLAVVVGVLAVALIGAIVVTRKVADWQRFA